MELQKLMIVSVCLVFSVSCTRKKETSNLTIQLPTFTTASHEVSGKAGKVSALVNGVPPWNTSLNPSSSTDVNCYAVFVAGPEENLKANKCFTVNATGNINPASVVGFGPHVGFIPAGGIVAVDVPSGPDRVVHLVGLKAQNGACKNFVGGGQLDFSNLSEPHVLSTRVVDLAPGDVNLTMIAKVDANTKTFNKCDFINDDGGPPEQLFGDGSDGDHTINTTVSDLSSDTSLGREMMFSDRVVGVNATGKTLTLSYLDSATQFQVGDEVLYVVTSAGGGAGPGPDAVCDGGNGLHRGAYGFSKVKAVSVGTQKITLEDAISQDPSQIVNTTLAEPGNDPTSSPNPFCRIQVVRVPEFNNLTLDATSSGFDLFTLPFDGEKGGIIAMKVKGTLHVLGGNTVQLNAKGKGFAGGAVDKGGFGINGRQVSSPNGSDNAGTAVSGEAGGGGANNGAGGAGAGGGGAGGADVVSIGLCGPNCPPGQKIFFGGGGAGANGIGGNGGGMILLFAKELKMDGFSTFNLLAGGDDGVGGNPSTDGAGGGAGGTILSTFKSVVHNAGGSTPSFSMNADGGQGGFGGSGGSAANGGGGGGGGAVELRSCQDPTTVTSVTLGAFSSGGVGGTGGGGGTNGADGGDAVGLGALGSSDYSIQDPGVCVAE